MIIAVDYDGILETADGMNTTLLNRLRANQRRGDAVILWTCREGRTLTEALRKLRAVGFVPTLVNENTPDVIRRFGRNTRKIYADVYIDDKAAK